MNEIYKKNLRYKTGKSTVHRCFRVDKTGKKVLSKSHSHTFDYKWQIIEEGNSLERKYVELVVKLL